MPKSSTWNRPIVVGDRLSYQREIERKKAIHQRKLSSMTAKLDNKRPTKYRHLSENLKRLQLEDEYCMKIEVGYLRVANDSIQVVVVVREQLV